MTNVRDGRGNDTLFNQTVTDAFNSAIYPPTPVGPPSGGGGGGTSPPGQVVQPKVLLAEWRADSPGTVDIDNSLGVPVVTAWRDAINGYELKSPSIAQSPLWVTPTNTPQERPGLSFDGIDDWLETLVLGGKLNNLSGLTMTMRLNVMSVDVNTLGRIAWIESGAAGVPRFGYGRTGIGSYDFYVDGVTRDTDPNSPISGGVYEYEGWATHTVRRDYVNGTARVDYNGGVKLQGNGIPTVNYGDSTAAIRFRLGAQNQGQNPGAFYIYGCRLYTYAITDNEMAADAAYYGGLY